MGQAPRPLTPHLSPRHFFGAELRYWREQRGLSQAALDRLIHFGEDTICKVEKAVRWPPPGLAEACDQALGTGGVLARLWPLVEHQRANASTDADSVPGQADNAVPGLVSDIDGVPSSEGIVLSVDEEGRVWASVSRRRFLLGGAAVAVRPQLVATSDGSRRWVLDVASSPADPFGFAVAAHTRWRGTRVLRADGGSGTTLVLPGGRALDGTAATLHLHPARRRGAQLVLEPDDPAGLEAALRTTSRSLIVAVQEHPAGNRFFALDGREARRRLRQRASSTPVVPVPWAYELDDLTYGVLWATANFDDALLADDLALADSHQDLSLYEQLPSSAVSREAAPDLSAAARMWLGSDFCARYILRHLGELPDQPVYWTREQWGEEASTWLLFRHKYDYLLATGRRHTGGEPLTRAFCVPREAVDTSPTAERILLFLAVALMESVGIQALVCTDPAYAHVEGFVLAPGRRALIANWVRADGVWHVDTTARRPRLREFADAAGHAQAHSVIAADTPAGRLVRLADYLGLDWGWLRRRCAQLAEEGWAGLVRPRSRLLTTDGLDTACQFLAGLEADLS
ncbi:helix-turn-helix domain-containing protein [Carbonactinospora thermoautotrophica]|nr:helix-turn-helix transcriptional regulator [Carbonactinospora thermoautotrophica]